MDYDTTPMFALGLLVFIAALAQGVRTTTKAGRNASSIKAPPPSNDDLAKLVTIAALTIIAAIGDSSIMIIAAIVEATDKTSP